MRIPLLTTVALLGLVGSLNTRADLLVYEPFDYPDGWLDGQGGALGTTGTWTTTDTGLADGWRVHPEGELSGVHVAADTPNVFDGTVDNLPTSGGFAGMAGPEDRGLPAGTDGGTGNLDASIALDPSVTATFLSGSTTWFSFVSVHAWDRNQGAPQFMISSETTTGGSRGLTMVNAGNGIGGGGGPPRRNLQDIYPQFFRDGVNNHTPGGYEYTGAVVFNTGTFGLHDGIQRAFGSGNDSTASGTLDENGQERTQTMQWVRDNPDGSFGAVNIVVGKIEWDADTAGEDVISLVRFLDTDTLSEAAFDAQIALLPALSSRNWDSNKPNLDQSQFDTLNFSSLKFFIDEIRLATTFAEALKGGVAPAVPPQLTITNNGPNLDIAWESNPGMFYVLRSNTDLEVELPTWESVDVPGSVENNGVFEIAHTAPVNTHTIPRPADATRFYRVEEFALPPVMVFEESFDTTDAGSLPAGWATGRDAADTLMNTDWELGVPDSGVLGGPLAAFSAPNCIGTNLTGPYGTESNIWLRTPIIDLTTATAATLTFQHWVDIDDLFADGGTVRVLAAAGLPGTVTELGVVETNINGILLGEWKEYLAELPAAALGQSVVLEFGFVSDDDDFPVSGWYLDDVVVTTPAP